MKIILYLTAFLFSLGQIGRISFLNQQINFYLYEILICISIFFGLLYFRLKPIKESFINSKPIFYFFGVLALSLLFGFFNYRLIDNIIASFYLFRLGLYFLFWIYISFWIKKNKHRSELKRQILAIISILTIITTIIQYFLYPDLRNLIYLGWDPHLYRTFGIFFDTTVSASIYGLLFFLNSNIFIKILYLIFLAFSFSRSAYIAFVISVIYLFLTNKQIKIMIIYLVLLISLVFIAPKQFGEGVNLTRTFSIFSRVKDYQDGLKLFLERPIIGYGYNRLRTVKKDYTSHSGSAFSSSYLTILVSAGVMGFISLIGLMRLIWTKTAGKYRSVLIFLATISFFDNVFLHPFILYLLFVNLADN